MPVKALLKVILLFTIFSSNANKLQKNAPQKNTIIAGYSFEHYSTTLQQKRRYMVSLPEGYYSNTRQYPILYVIDGDFHFQHTSALALNLARMGKTPPMIVIGIANQGAKDYVYTTTWPIKGNTEESKDYGGAAKFSTYLQNELLPTIDKQYRTSKQKALAGYSLGALFTTFEMMQPNTPFNAFLAMSPSAWFDDYSLPNKISDYVKNKKKPLADFFISVANEEEMGVDQTIAALKSTIKNSNNSMLKNWHWQFKHYPNESHFSTAMPALYDALTFLNPNYYIAPQTMMKLKGYQQVLAQFKTKQKNWAGFQFEWVQAYKFAQYIFWSKQTNKVDELLTAIKKDFPESLTLISIQIAKGFIIKKKPNRALSLLNNVKTSGQNNAFWQHQMSLALNALGQKYAAKKHQHQALKLAKQQQFSSWQIWEIKE